MLDHRQYAAIMEICFLLAYVPVLPVPPVLPSLPAGGELDVEVVSSPAALEASRREYESRRGVERLRSELEKVLNGESTSVLRLYDHGARTPEALLHGALRRVCASPVDAAIRVEAGGLLFAGDARAGRPILFGFLDHPSAAVRARALTCFRGSPGYSHLAFEGLVVDDPVPRIDSEYRTIADGKHRAIAGLSMGAGQAVRVGLGHADKFAHIGAFCGDFSSPLFRE